jgi:serine/threonine protein kinase/tetratricopeptide (TPR) repeat protein
MALEGVVSASLFRFGDEFHLDLGAYELRRAGQPIRLGRIPMELLLLLVEQRGQLVTRVRIIERVWGKDVFLDTDNSINAAIRKIRQVLEDDPEQPRFVQTVIGRGYRFIASVENATSPSIQPPVEEQISEGLVGKKVSHYRILQLLGGGGMGLVYMAEDLKLGRRVAIKFLPEELADDPIALDRLQREARAASALDHPNICSIYELGEHQGQPFIVMQLLEGQTLREWIEAAAVLSAPRRTSQLLDLAIQIADGLKAAHQNSTIHRDIKPANIFVTRKAQAKILDFGVAQVVGTPRQENATSSDEPGCAGHGAIADIHLTNSLASVGTPSYLSPEQIRRDPLDVRTDLFSFGLVLYEMATGQRAFSGNSPTVIRNAVLQLPAVSPRHLNPDLPPELERIINTCLEKDPAARYQSAAELKGDLEGVFIDPALAAAKSRRLARWFGASVLLILFVLLGMNIGGIRERIFRRVAPLDSAIPIKARSSVAVLGFKNLSAKDDQAWISTALSEMLDADLAAGQRLHLIAGENVARMKVDLALPAADSYSAATLKQVHEYLRSDMVVLGSYLALGNSTGGKIRINLRLQDAKAGETIAVISEDGTEADLAELVSRSGDRVRQILRMGSLSADDAGRVRTALPANPEAARFYAEGLAQLRSFDPLTARDRFLKAIAADPNHALSHAALSECWSALGYDRKAQEEAKKAVALSSKLSREEQLSVEGRYRQAAHQWQRASEIYRMLWGFFPDNLDYGLDLASVQSSAGLAKEAMDTVNALSKAPPPAGDDPRIDIAEAIAADKVGDLRREEMAAARAVEKGRRQGARILTANALLTRGSALGALGDTANAIMALKEAQTIFSAVGERQGVARVLNNLGIVERHQSNLAEAQKHLEQSLEISRQTGSKLGMVLALSNLGNVLWDRGEMARTLEVHQQSLKFSREIDDRIHQSSSLNNLGGLMTLQGKLGDARRMYDESLRLSSDAGDQEGVGFALGNIADLLTRLGELAAARKLAEDALAIDQQVGAKSLEGYALHQLGSILVSQGDLADGRTKFQDAIALRHELGEKVTEAESQLALAQLQLDMGDVTGAESDARSTAGVFHEGSSTDDEALSYSLLALALWTQGKSAEAQQIAERADKLSASAVDVATRIQIELASAYLAGVLHSHAGSAQSHASNREAAAGALAAAREKSNRFRFVGLELEARLRLADLELQSGKGAAGRVHLKHLQQDARTKGFLLVARKASNALHADSTRRHND